MQKRVASVSLACRFSLTQRFPFLHFAHSSVLDRGHVSTAITKKTHKQQNNTHTTLRSNAKSRWKQPHPHTSLSLSFSSVVHPRLQVVVPFVFTQQTSPPPPRGEEEAKVFKSVLVLLLLLLLELLELLLLELLLLLLQEKRAQRGAVWVGFGGWFGVANGSWKRKKGKASDLGKETRRQPWHVGGHGQLLFLIPLLSSMTQQLTRVRTCCFSLQ